MSDRPIVRRAPYRPVLSVGTVLALVGSSLYYALREPTPTQRTSVVTYLETVGPFWPTAFGLAAVAILVALVLRRGLNAAHLIAAGVFAAYAFALFYSAASTGSGWLTACMSTGLCVHTIALAASYTRG